MVAQIDGAYLRAGVGRAARRLASYALFEGRPITTRGRWANPLVFAWLRALAALPGRPAVKAPIFITGLGRSGTTILGLLLSLHREVGFLNEPKAIWSVIDPRHDVNGNYSRGGGVFRMPPAWVDERTRVRAARLYARYLRLVGARRVVDKYPELIFRVDYLLSLFPDARVVLITRNGIDACASIARWSREKGVDRDGGREDWWGREDCKWWRLWDELVVPDERLAALASRGTAGLDDVSRAAVEWVVTMREGMAQVARHPGRVYRVRYEDLVTDTARQLDALLAFCGLWRDPAVYAYATRRLYRLPRRPLPALVAGLDAVFQETMADLGYGDLLARAQSAGAG